MWLGNGRDTTTESRCIIAHGPHMRYSVSSDTRCEERAYWHCSVGSSSAVRKEEAASEGAEQMKVTMPAGVKRSYTGVPYSGVHPLSGSALAATTMPG